MVGSLPQEVTSEILRYVTLIYLDRSSANAWNYNRDKGDIRVFCGWYWSRGRTEAGPFKTASAALRDAYYHVLRNAEPPRLMQPKRLRLVSANGKERKSA